VRWVDFLWQLIRDVVLTGTGVWIIWRQAEAQDPNTTLLAVALVCIAPAARSAVATLLSGPSGPGSSSESQDPQEERPSLSSPPEGGTGEPAEG
jgi:hypothetical protein